MPEEIPGEADIDSVARRPRIAIGLEADQNITDDVRCSGSAIEFGRAGQMYDPHPTIPIKSNLCFAARAIGVNAADWSARMLVRLRT